MSKVTTLVRFLLVGGSLFEMLKQHVVIISFCCTMSLTRGTGIVTAKEVELIQSHQKLFSLESM